MEKMSLEYIAGFFDGEGCVDHTYDKYSGLRLRFTQKDRYVLDKIQKYLGCGRIYRENRDGMHRLLLRYKTARKVARLLLPYLIVKKQKVIDGLKIWDDKHTRP